MVGADIEPLSIGDPLTMPDFNPSASEDALALANEVSPEPGNDRRSLWFSVWAVEYIIVGQRYIEDVLVRCVFDPVRVPGASQVPRIAAVWELADPKYRRPYAKAWLQAYAHVRPLKLQKLRPTRGDCNQRSWRL
jgi:hypothetical protein